MWKQVKAFCVAAHRYLGFLLSLLFVVWFLSGFVMMYVDFPVWGMDKQLRHAAPLDGENVHLSVSDAAGIAGLSHSPGSVRLEMMLDRPVYRFEDRSGRRAHIYGDTGEPLRSVSGDTAADIARQAYGEEAVFRSTEHMQGQDQWIPQQGNARYLPYFRFKLDDPEKTWIYVSEAGGELFLMVTGRERFLAWLGPIPHWIYFKNLRTHADAWREVIIWTSGLGTIMCLFGIITGLTRFRKKRNQSSLTDKFAFSPYKENWFRWHHYFGFIFGLVIFTWTISGLFSVNPWGLSPPRSLSAGEQIEWQGGVPVFTDYIHDMSDLIEAGNEKLDEVRRVELHRFRGTPYYRLYDQGGGFVSAGSRDETLFTKERWSENDLLGAIQEVTAGKPLFDVQILVEYDNHYYSRDGSRPLPVIRIRYNDPSNTWYYIDPSRAEVVMKNESRSRIYRWLYNGLHSLDFSFLINRRPLWDVVVIFLMAGGTIASISGLVLTWRWIRGRSR